MTVAEAVTLIAAIGALVTSVGSVAIGWRNASKLDVVHTIVNSQATKFEALAMAAGHAEGVAEGKSVTAPDAVP